MPPYLHFGHLSVHEVLAGIGQIQSWSPEQLTAEPNRKREGWWQLPASTEAFLDELVTWRELGYNVCAHRPTDCDRYESLPDWAQTTLAAHAQDPRPHGYSLAELERGRTHDELWNAAHAQLVRDGWFHNQMRMLRGKKILEWSPSPRAASATMTELMNKYWLDGRNPNSYARYFWVLGRDDRSWYTDRPIFGRVRYLSSISTVRKAQTAEYVSHDAPEVIA